MKSTSLAYWVGVAQTDACFKKAFSKKRKQHYYRISLCVGEKSIPMLKKFKESSQKIFGVKGTTWYNKKRKCIDYCFGCKKLLVTFKELEINFSDPPIPPSWIINDNKLFGAYLAGLIDGDGDVRIKRKKYPQCAVRINSGTNQKELIKIIKNKLNIGVSSNTNIGGGYVKGRRIKGKSYRAEFYVSSKNFEFLTNFVLNNIEMKYKKNKIKNYIYFRKNTKCLKNKT